MALETLDPNELAVVSGSFGMADFFQMFAMMMSRGNDGYGGYGYNPYGYNQYGYNPYAYRYGNNGNYGYNYAYGYGNRYPYNYGSNQFSGQVETG